MNIFLSPHCPTLITQASRFVLIKDNIAYGTKCAGMHQHYGIDQMITNNIFGLVDDEECDAGLRSSTHDSPGDEGDISSFSFIRNILMVNSGAMFFATTNNRCGVVVGIGSWLCTQTLFSPSPALPTRHLTTMCTGTVRASKPV